MSNKVNTNKTTNIKNHEQSRSEKNTYIKPKLTKYGKVAKITKGVGSIDFDEGSIVPDLP